MGGGGFGRHAGGTIIEVFQKKFTFWRDCLDGWFFALSDSLDFSVSAPLSWLSLPFLIHSIGTVLEEPRSCNIIAIRLCLTTSTTFWYSPWRLFLWLSKSGTGMEFHRGCIWPVVEANHSYMSYAIEGGVALVIITQTWLLEFPEMSRHKWVFSRLTLARMIF